MSIGAVDFNLGKHGEGHSVLVFGKILDFGLMPWILAAKLIAGKTKDYESFFLVGLPKGLQFTELGGEASKAGRIDNQHDLAAVFCHGGFLPVDPDQFDLLQFHRKSPYKPREQWPFSNHTEQ